VLCGLVSIEGDSRYGYLPGSVLGFRAPEVCNGPVNRPTRSRSQSGRVRPACDLVAFVESCALNIKERRAVEAIEADHVEFVFAGGDDFDH